LFLSPFLNAGQTLAYLQSSGILPVLSDKLNNVVEIGAICVVHSLSILPCILSGPDAKNLFSYIKSQKSESSNIATLRQNGQLHSDTKTKANILNEQF
jgi:coenzyme F420-reducing hydrogenase alpha subunit